LDNFDFLTKCTGIFSPAACTSWRVVLQNQSLLQFSGQFLSLSEKFDLNAIAQKAHTKKTSSSQRS
jgi:hypothetical protein